VWAFDVVGVVGMKDSGELCHELDKDSTDFWGEMVICYKCIECGRIWDQIINKTEKLPEEWELQSGDEDEETAVQGEQL